MFAFCTMIDNVILIIALSVGGGIMLTLFGICAWYLHEHGLRMICREQSFKEGYLTLILDPGLIWTTINALKRKQFHFVAGNSEYTATDKSIYRNSLQITQLTQTITMAVDHREDLANCSSAMSTRKDKPTITDDYGSVFSSGPADECLPVQAKQIRFTSERIRFLSEQCKIPKFPCQ